MKRAAAGFVFVRLSLLFGAFLPQPAVARWAAEKDAPFVYEFYRSSYKVEKDGSYTNEVEFKAKILKASGIKNFGSYSLTYNEKSDVLQILSAKTESQGKDFPLDLKRLEDKPLAAAHGGFDQIRQVLVAFPKVQIGSSVYLRYRHQEKIPPYKNFFSFSMSPSRLFAKKLKIKIESALPLFYKANNPGNFFKVSYRKKRGRHALRILLRRPIFKAIAEEKNKFPDPDLLPYVDVASAKKWPQMAGNLSEKYEEAIAGALPKMHEGILKAARKIKTGPEDQIDFVISSLIEKIRYLRDWQPINGGYIPRPLDKIAETGFGDCKDLSVSLSAILRRLGFRARAALIYRGFAPLTREFQLPSGMAFNHAIVRAELKGKVFWLDPTNRAAYSRGLFEDIADRPVLILQSPKPEMARTPKLKSGGAALYLTQEFYLRGDGSAKVTGEMRFSGRSAVGFAGASLYESKKTTDYRLIQYTSANTSTLSQWEAGGYDLSSRIARDFSAKFSYTEGDGGLFNFWTQLGPAFRFPFLSHINLFWIRAKDRVSGAFTLHPQRYVFVSRLKNIKPAGALRLNCRLSSPWADFSREAISQNPLTVKDVYEFKKARISAKELKGKEFFRLSNGLNRCFNRFLMVYKKTD